ncbi:response regulator [Porifericola rhodea]|uniref:response regulator n=1 Tax=Porifericola rhodea TaxID=930972 RepID=UPI0026660021|nr:response regulator [Porifericola rhodea]WKN31456.1 response regulator [Porifericola rhodea]
MRKFNLACIVDDDPTHVYITKRQVLMTGMVETIMICSNGKEAYDKMKAIMGAGETLPELILLDLNMPVWDGWQFLEEFIKIPVEQKIMIYLLTSSTSEEDLQKADSYNLTSNYLIKPITYDQLKQVFQESA